MNQTRRLFAALAVGLLATACATAPPVPTVPSVPKGTVQGPEAKLPEDLGPGLLFIRIVTGEVGKPGAERKAYAVIVHVGKDRTPTVRAVVGPIEDWPAFFSKVRATYWAHGPGEAYCSRPESANPKMGSCDYLSRGAPGRYQPLPPPVPPPPADGYALSYFDQTGPVDPNSSALNDSAAAAAAGAAKALGQ
jgi:hypothetical protein